MRRCGVVLLGALLSVPVCLLTTTTITAVDKIRIRRDIRHPNPPPILAAPLPTLPLPPPPPPPPPFIAFYPFNIKLYFTLLSSPPSLLPFPHLLLVLWYHAHPLPHPLLNIPSPPPLHPSLTIAYLNPRCFVIHHVFISSLTSSLTPHFSL